MSNFDFCKPSIHRVKNITAEVTEFKSGDHDVACLEIVFHGEDGQSQELECYFDYKNNDNAAKVAKAINAASGINPDKKTLIYYGRTFSAEIPVQVGDGEVVVAVEYTYTRGSPAVLYQRNGDPGWPAEPPEVEILSATVAGEQLPKWFDAEASDYLHEWLLDNHDNSPAEPDPDAARERMREDVA